MRNISLYWNFDYFSVIHYVSVLSAVQAFKNDCLSISYSVKPDSIYWSKVEKLGIKQIESDKGIELDYIFLSEKFDENIWPKNPEDYSTLFLRSYDIPTDMMNSSAIKLFTGKTSNILKSYDLEDFMTGNSVIERICKKIVGDGPKNS